MLSIEHEARIRAACADLCATAPELAVRFTAARNLLIQGGWTHLEGTVLFPGGIAASERECTCQEGRGPMVCLHQIARRIAQLAEAPNDWPVAEWLVLARAKTLELRHCPAPDVREVGS